MNAVHPPMRLVCPGCGCYGTIETFANFDDAIVVGKLLGAMPPLVASAMQRYVRMFAPAKHEMTWRRARRVLEPLAPLIDAQSIQSLGRQWAAPHTAWIEAVNGMLDSKTVKMPLKGNGYLFSVLTSAAEKAEAADERKVEAQRVVGRPAQKAEDIEKFNADVRTATAMLVSEATIVRTRFREELSDEKGAEHIAARGFSRSVIDAAVAQWKRTRKPA